MHAHLKQLASTELLAAHDDLVGVVDDALDQVFQGLFALAEAGLSASASASVISATAASALAGLRRTVVAEPLSSSDLPAAAMAAS